MRSRRRLGSTSVSTSPLDGLLSFPQTFASWLTLLPPVGVCRLRLDQAFLRPCPGQTIQRGNLGGGWYRQVPKGDVNNHRGLFFQGKGNQGFQFHGVAGSHADRPEQLRKFDEIRVKQVGLVGAAETPRPGRGQCCRRSRYRKTTVVVLIPYFTAVASSDALNMNPPSPTTHTTGRSGRATLTPSAVGNE